MRKQRIEEGGVSLVPAPISSYAAYVRRKRWAICVVALATTALACVSLSVGSIPLSSLDIARGLIGTADAQVVTVVRNMRLPRVLTALVAGTALSLAGCAFQGVLRNPLASASTLGVSQGAAFGAAVSIVVLVAPGASFAYEGVGATHPLLTAACAFVGAMASSVVVLLLSRVRNMGPEGMVLAGVAISTLFTGATALVQYFAEDTQVAAIVFWTFGDLSRVRMPQLVIMTLSCALTAAYLWVRRWDLNALEAGEGLAHGLSVDVHRVRLATVVVAAACSSAVIAFCGIVNFVGLVAPHVMRRVIGSDYRYLLPASAVCGAAVLLAADVVAHVVALPLILPISAVTSFVGAPVFLWILLRGEAR